jgi:hypothetical protein
MVGGAEAEFGKQAGLHLSWASGKSGFARKVGHTLSSLCNLCVLCVSVVVFLNNNEPQRHRAHRGCTEKNSNGDFSCKAR